MEAASGLSLVAIGKEVGAQFSAVLEILDTAYERRVINELQRFQLWASSLGLYHTGHSSLDYRFRDSPPLFDYAFTLLKDLQGALLSLTEVAEEAPANSPSDTDIPNVNEDLTMRDDSSEEDFSSYQAQPLATEYIANVSITIDRLYALSFRIRNPAMRTGLSRGFTYAQVDEETGVDLITALREWDFKHVAEVFRGWLKDVEPESYFLAQRLALANTRRRQQFKYWENRKAKYSYYHHAAMTEDFIEAKVPQSKQPHAAHWVTGVDRSRLSEPSTATFLESVKLADNESAVSIDSFAVINHEGADVAVLPPPPEIDADSTEFECPYCFILCGRRSLERRAWGRHVVRDLRPYTCTFEVCKEPHQQYDTLTEWIGHELSKHGQPPGALRKCPFCFHSNATTVHIASHMRRIACFALPRFKREASTSALGTGSLSKLSIGDSEANGKSFESSIVDEWADNVKVVLLRLLGDTEMTAELHPNESLTAYLLHNVRELYSFSESTIFTFKDANGASIPVDYDSLYSDMVIVVEALNSQPANIPTMDILGESTRERARERKFSTAALFQGSDLDLGYKVENSDYFRPGKVFSIFWHENGGRMGNRWTDSTVRRMVVFKNFDRYSWCLSMSTYNGQGVAKLGVNASKHAIVYLTGTAPFASPMEPIIKTPLEVKAERNDETWHPMTRLNFDKIITLEHNVKVLRIGEITEDSMVKFLEYARLELYT